MFAKSWLCSQGHGFRKLQDSECMKNSQDLDPTIQNLQDSCKHRFPQFCRVLTEVRSQEDGDPEKHRAARGRLFTFSMRCWAWPSAPGSSTLKSLRDWPRRKGGRAEAPGGEPQSCASLQARSGFRHAPEKVHRDQRMLRSSRRPHARCELSEQALRMCFRTILSMHAHTGAPLMHRFQVRGHRV